MPPYIDQPIEEFYNKIFVGNLPTTINGKDLHKFFRRFGHIVQMKLKRRLSKTSNISRFNPTAILQFEYRTSVDQVMTERPHFISDHQIFVNRCLPITRRYPYEPFDRLHQLILRSSIDDEPKILPENDRIKSYFNENIGGHLIHFERLDDQTILIEFDDYDPVDLSCLLRPHYIDQQLIEVEKCYDEKQLRRQIQNRAKSRSLTMKISPNLSIRDVETQSNKTISPSLSVPFRHQIQQIRFRYAEILNQIEREHERQIKQLKTEWKCLALERIRFQRLTFDCQDDFRYLQDQIYQSKWKLDENLRDHKKLLVERRNFRHDR